MPRTLLNQKTQESTWGPITVKPSHLGSIHLGMYERTMSEPKFRLLFEPHQPEAITAHLARVECGDHYELVYHFQSYGDVPIRVTVEADA